MHTNARCPHSTRRARGAPRRSAVNSKAYVITCTRAAQTHLPHTRTTQRKAAASRTCFVPLLRIEVRRRRIATLLGHARTSTLSRITRPQGHQQHARVRLENERLHSTAHTQTTPLTLFLSLGVDEQLAGMRVDCSLSTRDAAARGQHTHQLRLTI